MSFRSARPRLAESSRSSMTMANEVPPGVEGQIIVAGADLSPGYWQRPEQTDAVFAEHPDDPTLRTYSSGDYGLIDDEGRLRFIGRRDDRVKVRGYRVELNEVAQNIRSLDGVSDVHVIVDPNQAERLVAYVVASPGAVVNSTTIRSELAERVASHLIPSLFVELDALPLTANGKLDASSLPPVSAGAQRASTPFIAPRTPTEQRIADIWAEALNADDVGMLDQFTELGGDSLTAMRIVAGVVDRCEVQVELRQLLEHGTVEGMARLVDGLSPAAATPMPAGGDGPAPVSHQQQNIWLSEQVSMNSKLNMVKVIDLQGPLDVVALGRSLDNLIARHPVLRTTYELSGAELVQVLHPAPNRANADLRLQSDAGLGARRRSARGHREPSGDHL